MKNPLLSVVLLLGLATQLQAQDEYKPAWQDRQSGKPARIFHLDYDFGLWDSVEYASFVYVPGTHDYTALQRNYTQGQWLLTGRYVYHFDSSARLLDLWKDYDSLGTWRPIESRHYTYDTFGIETSSVWLDHYLNANDTVVALRATISYGPGGLPDSIVGENWTPWGGWGPNETRTYHYNGNMEQDTMWLFYPQLSSQPYKIHIYHSWHDFALRLTDSVTVISVNDPPGTYLSIKTTYTGNMPLLYHNWKYYAGIYQAERLIELDQNGFYQLDSTYIHSGSQIGPSYCYRWENPVNTSGFRTEERIFRYDTAGFYLPTLKMVYQYDSIAAGTASDSPLELSVWPNPASTQVQIQLQSAEDVQVRLYDLQGRLRLFMLQPADHRPIQLSIPPSLEEGAYVLQILSANRSASRKILIQH